MTTERTGLVTIGALAPADIDHDGVQGQLLASLDRRIAAMTSDGRRYHVERLIPTRRDELHGTVITVAAVVALVDWRDAKEGEYVTEGSLPEIASSGPVRARIPGVTLGSVKASFERKPWASSPGVTGVLYQRVENT